MLTLPNSYRAPLFHEYVCTAAQFNTCFIAPRALKQVLGAVRRGNPASTRARPAVPEKAPNPPILRAETLLQILVAEAF